MLAGEMYSEGTARPRFTGSPFKIRSRTASWPTRVGTVRAPPRLCFATHFSHPLYSSPGDMTTSFRRPASSKASATPIDIWPAGENTPSIRGWRWSRFSVICLALARFQSPYSALSSSICENSFIAVLRAASWSTAAVVPAIGSIATILPWPRMSLKGWRATTSPGPSGLVSDVLQAADQPRVAEVPGGDANTVRRGLLEPCRRDGFLNSRGLDALRQGGERERGDNQHQGGADRGQWCLHGAPSDVW